MRPSTRRPTPPPPARSSPLVVLVFAAALLSSPVTRANNTADEADIAFQMGNDAYARRQYVEALRSYFLSYRLVPNRNVLFNIARCYEAAQRYDEAYRYFHDLSQLDLAPSDAASVAAALKRISPRVALIRITSEPPGAEVFADREDLGSRGRTPLTLALPPGKHLIRVRLADHLPAEAGVELTLGKEVDQALTLEHVMGAVSVTGSPAGAEIRLVPDGPVIGLVPTELKLPTGRRTLHFSAPGHAPAQLAIDVADGPAAALQAALAPESFPTGTLLVTANRENVLVRVDGKASGFTPVVLTLREGEHQIEFSQDDVRPHTERVVITRETAEKLHVELRYAPPPVQAASKRLLSIDDAPASTTVVSREELQAFGYTTLAEALQAVRGIYLSNDGQYDYLGIRGFSPPGDLNTRVLILWDGHPMNDVWAGQGYAGHDLTPDLEEVERIEVVRGPGSALYGTGAFFAVINVVPRDRLESGRNVEATLMAGGRGSTRGHVAGSLGHDRERSLTLSASGLTATGEPLTDLGSLGTVRELDAERAISGTLRARWKGLSAHAFFNSRTKEVATAPYGTGVGVPGTEVTDSRGFAELRFDHDFTPTASLSARAYYDQSSYKGFWARAPQPGDTATLRDTDGGGAQWTGAEVRARFSPFSGNTLTAGVEAQQQLRINQEIFGLDGAKPAIDDQQRTLLSAYLLDEWQLLPGRLALSGGFRVDRYLDLSVTSLTPRLALIARPYKGGLTKLVGGTAFRAPNVYELYNGTGGAGAAYNAAAAELEPERIQTFELEHAHNLTEELRLTVGTYLNRIQKLVVTREAAGPYLCGEPAGTAPCLVNANLDDTLTAIGAEAELRWQPGRFTLVDVNYSFVSLDLENHPSHLIGAKLLIPLVDRAVRLSAQGVYQSARTSPLVPDGAGDALLLNVGLSGETGHLRYFAGATNLLDAKYALPVNDEYRQSTVQQAGRGFLIRMTGTY